MKNLLFLATPLLLLTSINIYANQTVTSFCPKSQDILIQHLPHSSDAAYSATVNGVGYAGFDTDVGSVPPFYQAQIQAVGPNKTVIECIYSTGHGVTIPLFAGKGEQKVSHANFGKGRSNQTMCLDPTDPQACALKASISEYNSTPILSQQ